MKKVFKRTFISSLIALVLCCGIVFAATSGQLLFNFTLFVANDVFFYIVPEGNASGQYYDLRNFYSNMKVSPFPVETQDWVTHDGIPDPNPWPEGVYNGHTFSIAIIKDQSGNGQNNGNTMYLPFANMGSYPWTVSNYNAGTRQFTDIAQTTVLPHDTNYISYSSNRRAPGTNGPDDPGANTGQVTAQNQIFFNRTPTFTVTNREIAPGARAEVAMTFSGRVTTDTLDAIEFTIFFRVNANFDGNGVTNRWYFLHFVINFDAVYNGNIIRMKDQSDIIWPQTIFLL